MILLDEQRASPPAAGHHVAARAGGDHRRGRGGLDAPGSGAHRVQRELWPASAAWSRETAQVLTGLDVLAAQNFAPLAGKRVGLITNHTSVDLAGRRNVDLMLQAGVNVTALFSPEHGATGEIDGATAAVSEDPATGIPIWSLYYGDPPAVAGNAAGFGRPGV